MRGMDDLESEWRGRKYGRISGLGLERYVLFIDQVDAIRSEFKASDTPESYGRLVKYISSIPNWAHYYRVPMTKLLQLVIGATGIAEVVAAAAKSEEPQVAFMGAISSSVTPIGDPGKDAMAVIFAAMGNAEAISRYSMSIYDMLQLAALRQDPKLIRQAISIDAYVLTMPLVMSQMRIGQLIGDMSGADFLVAGLRGPDKRRSVYSKLRMVEYLLREMGAFESCSEKDIHDLVVLHLGLYDDDTKLDDSKKALFALFRKWQKSVGN